MTVEEPTLFPDLPTVPPSEYATASRDRRLTLRARARIAAGIHPFGRPLLFPSGETCRGCTFAIRVDGGNRRYWKCELHSTSRSAASDLRLSWPACVAFRARG